MEEIFALAVLTLLTISLIAIVRPLPRLGIPTRGKAGGLLFLSLLLLVIFDAIWGEEKETAPLEKTQTASWTVHDYQVIENKDISFPGRVRRKIHITAPTAVTQEDRIATLMAATIDEHRKTWPAFISIFMTLEEIPDAGIVARIKYAPDGCGVSGDDCTGQIWTDARASEGNPSLEQVAIRKAWDTHKERFREKQHYDWGEMEEVNEERLRAFLAKEFNVTPEHISQQILAVFTLTTLMAQHEVELPAHQREKGILTEDEQEKAKRGP